MTISLFSIFCILVSYASGVNSIDKINSFCFKTFEIDKPSFEKCNTTNPCYIFKEEDYITENITKSLVPFPCNDHDASRGKSIDIIRAIHQNLTFKNPFCLNVGNCTFNELINILELHSNRATNHSFIAANFLFVTEERI